MVPALSETVIGAIREAMQRAARNRRTNLMFRDLTCWADIPAVDVAATAVSIDEDFIVKDRLLRRIIRSRGFFADGAMMSAINDNAWLILETP